MKSFKSSSQQGFTMVELLIVLLTIGILAAIVVTAHNGVAQRNRNSERLSDLKTFQTQLEAYFAENQQHYPTTTDLGTNSANNLAFIGTKMKSLNKEVMRDPKASPHDYALATTAVLGTYAYAPTAEDGITTCDNTTVACTKYVLTAKQEGSSTDLVQVSLN